MTLWTAKEIVAAVNGQTESDIKVYGVSIDSRSVKAGDLFVALKGDNFDGHDYVGKALASGAAAAMVSSVPAGVDASRLIVTADSFKALEALGCAARARLKGRVIGVTGSVGKTSTRSMLEAMLGGSGKVHATSGNLNNHYGTPLTLSRMPAASDFAVIEMGMNHSGEIHDLTLQARPDVAIITTVEAVHLEFFGSVEKIAEAKAEIFDGMAAGAVAVVNQDNQYTSVLRDMAAKRKLRIISFGAVDEADVRLLSHAPRDGVADIVVSYNGVEIDFSLPHSGRHMALNACGVLAVAVALGLDMHKSAAALSLWQPEAGRGNITEIILSGGRKINLIDDSYNASPASVKAALEMLAARKDNSRKIVALGDMRELGADAKNLHLGLRQSLEASGVEKFFAAGENMLHLYNAMPEKLRGAYAITAEELLPLLEASLIDGDILLVKGSHGSNMWKLVNKLQRETFA